MKKFKNTFALICAALMILALLPSCAGADGAAYSDVNSGDWFFENVTQMSADGLLKGYSDGTFKPGSTITSAEFVTVVSRAAGLSESASQNSHWAGGLMQTALDKGFYDWDEIPPTAETYDLPITRQLAVKITMNAFLPQASGDYTTETAKIKDFDQLDGRYYNAVIAAYASGVAGGDDNGRFNPKSSLTRAEACALITRAM